MKERKKNSKKIKQKCGIDFIIFAFKTPSIYSKEMAFFFSFLFSFSHGFFPSVSVWFFCFAFLFQSSTSELDFFSFWKEKQPWKRLLTAKTTVVGKGLAEESRSSKYSLACRQICLLCHWGLFEEHAPALTDFILSASWSNENKVMVVTVI